jgi:hypothetical protein
MNPSVEARLAKVRKLSRIGNMLCIGMMIFACLVACLIVVVGFASPDTAMCDFGAGRRPCGELTGGELALTVAIGFVILGLFLKGVYHLSRLFKNYADGQIFTRDSVGQIKRIGATVFAYAAFEVLVLIGAIVLMATQQLTWPEDRPLPLPFGSFIVGGLVMLISWVMEVGTELREETELTV